ncbi:hypothetical protein EVJ58_g3716 [Rhodofomes roseus]|uniref:Uncharacterized protein n=1 Tax=Rhodofomes roseus TaxID=34475 RepID=A0A4Y9YL36_9APHY|nr:hypothetical protein EVJ58_g3716 [Rhodofomes roseus]
MSITTMRPFIVFKDDTPPSPTGSIASLLEGEGALRPTSPTPSNGVSAPDKENINPITGRKAAPDTQNGKKRKEGALATKAYAPAPVKKTKGLKSDRTFGADISSRSKSAGQPPKRLQAARRNGASAASRPRRSPTLPQVSEEQETDVHSDNVREARRLSQSQIDARCYELTVLPLADLSKAYEQAPCLTGEHALSEKVRAQELNNDVVETSSVHDGSDRAPSPTPSVSSRSSSPARSEAVFSTPERKRIYSAFTFSSPSPSSARYAALRGPTDGRFSDPTFEL